MASATSVDASTNAPGPSHSGSVQAAVKAAAVPSGMPARTSGSRRAAGGRSRTLPARVSAASASRSVRRSTNWRTRIAAKTTPARTASPSAGFVGSSHATPCCSTPRATAAAAMVRRSEKLPSARAASAVTRAVRPYVGSSGIPTIAAWKKMLTNDNTPATTQVKDCKRPTGMPSMAARSRRSPVARTAMPTSLRVNQRDTAARHPRETTTATRSSAVKTTGATCHVACQGKFTTAVEMGVCPQMRGISRLTTTRNCDSPMVATVRIRRGDRRKRRTTTISTVAVRSTAATSPVANPRK